jgi:nucleoside-diphosphate-sugar epimerase
LRRPKRVVVAGAAGFVGAAVADRLERDGVAVLRLTRKTVDLAAPGAEVALAAQLKSGDAFIAAAARAPCKDADMLIENLAIARALAKALRRARDLVHVVNISSDAVYADSPDPLTEASCAAPATLHGVMHLAREIVLKSELKAPLANLRPTLLYGARDPHSGYGPNRFRRLAAKGEPIVLFGEGEERRDHVFIDDLAELVALVVYRRSSGTLNIATGEVHSFADVAQRVIALSGKKIVMKTTARSGPMPHGGYRPFDIAACLRAFPDFRYTPLHEGLKKAQDG